MYVINKDECIACGACAGTCPVSAIVEADGKYEITDALVMGKAVSKIKNFAGVYNVITSTYMMIGIIIFIGAYFFLTMNEKPKTYI